MAKNLNLQSSDRVIISIREYGISSLLYRHAIGSKLGLNATDMECLAALFFKGISSPSTLAQYTGLSSGATTAMLDRLEKARLIRRKPNPDDRRATIISVTPASKKLIGPFFTSLRHGQHNLMASYSDRDLNLIADFMQKLTNVWEEERKKLAQ